MLAEAEIETPAFVYEESRLVRAAEDLSRLAGQAGCKALCTLKPLTFVEVMRLVGTHLDGFAASSLFEARLAREVLGNGGTVHITTPGLRPDEMDRIAETCDYVAFNSLCQWSRLRDRLAGKARGGLRINPGLSFVEDDRYDPCRQHSKLGVPIDRLVDEVRKNADLLRDLSGLHFHTNCDCSSFQPLLATVRHLEAKLSDILAKLQWVNLGGGYLFGQAPDVEHFVEAVRLLREAHGLDVFVEPGAALVREAICIVASVIDLFDSGDKKVAVLDTTVNHMPEVFEYQFQPTVDDTVENGEYSYVLAGCSCLAGDVFGEYAFGRPLEIGQRIVFPEMGSYTMVKWNWFNGINLPAVYAVTGSGGCVLKKRFPYEDYARRCGEKANAST